MKIGLVLPNVPSYSETFFRNKIVGLQQNGHTVILYVNNSEAESKYHNCTVVKAPKLNGNKIIVLWNLLLELLKMIFINPKRSYRLYKFNKKDNVSFVKNFKSIVSNQFLLTQKLDWLHFGFGTMAIERENIAQAIVAKMAVSFRGYDHYVYPQKNKNCYEILSSKSVKYHVLSDGMKKSLEEKGISEANISKITPAIDINLFEALIIKKSTGILQIKTIARLHWIKGLEYTLEALALLKTDGIQFHYTIIGDGIEKERLVFAVHQLGLSENVTFTGKLSPQEIKEELSKTDIYLQYSIQEGFCNAVLEAQAMGLVCIVSDAEGLSENVLNNQTGFVVAKQNTQLLFEKIKQVIQLPETEKQVIQKNAILRVQTEFNLEKQREEFLKFYE